MSIVLSFFSSFFFKKGRFQDELHVRKRYFRMNLHTGTVLKPAAILSCDANAHQHSHSQLQKKERKKT